MATIKDVARRAGVSIGTVDRIIHNRGRYAPETARIVRQAIRELNYTPDLRARNLSLSRKCHIAVLMPYPEQDSGYWRLPFRGINRALDVLSASHVTARFYHFDRYIRDTFVNAVKQMNEQQFDGYIITPLLGEETLSLFKGIFEEKSVVFFDTDIENSGRFSYIGQNSKNAGHLAAKLINLISGGSEKKILIMGPDTENEHLQYRLDGFMERVNGKTDIIKIPTIPDRIRTSLEEIRKRIVEEYSAVYVTDSSSHYIARVLDEESVGKEIALVGFDMVPDNIYYLQNGIIDFILTQRPIDQGYIAVQTIYRKVMLGQNSSPEQFMPIDIITQENMNSFLNMKGHTLL